MEHYRAGLSHGTQLCQFNQLDSHDTSRFLTLLQGDMQRMKLAIGWLFSWIGVPCLYYGDEIGLAGENDPFCRAPFPWDQAHWNGELLAHTQQLARLRQQSPALRRGALQMLYAQDETLVFERVLEDERILVVIQRTGSRQLTLPSDPLLACQSWQRLLGSCELAEQEAELTLEVSEPGFSLFRGFTR